VRILVADDEPAILAAVRVYKTAKYVMRIELVETFKTVADGQGGYWEDRGYEWYAGI
jgi:DMSO/TMAO reductase YedYZ molybdopterin-dependent catalytic subunit